MCVAHHNELAEPGDFVLRDVAGESVIIVRGDDGVVRAFYNVCRHRGSRICDVARGTFPSVIRCVYHSWTYALDGRLRGAPLPSDVPDFDADALALRQVATGVWDGLVFVSLAPSAPFEAAFAPLHGKFAHWSLPKLRAARRIEYDVAANWKLLCPALARLTPSNRADTDLSEGPTLGGFMPIRAGGSVTTSGDACALALGPLDAADHARISYYSIFPNLFLGLHPDYALVLTLWPEGPARTRVHCEWLFHPDAFGRDDFHPDDAVSFWDTTNRQDWLVCERTQQGVSPGPDAPREPIAAAFDREYLRALES